MSDMVQKQIIFDAKERETALDVTRSFIVQAPAGSGKTALLTQRFLQLLTVVREPEEIIAITFTRKAAAEMRARILAAIGENTQWNTKAQAWGLHDNPNRLRVMTIDAFCLQLVQQMPLRAKLSPNISLTENADNYYYQAIERLFLFQESQNVQNALGKLLLHLDNDALRLSELLFNILRNRDQWLGHIYRFDLIEDLEAALQNIVEEHWQKVRRSCPPDYREDFEFVVDQLGKEKVANAFLTTEGQWRKRITGYNDHCKNKIKKLLINFATREDLREILNDCFYLPPTQYSATQKTFLNALVAVLPVLVAELQLIFAAHEECDFIEIALRASQALGEEDAPTDLALYLDYQIKHILVDEFQDTSVTQLQLLKKLTSGWQVNDGRTLFFVGDPMQSIYRFRKAEVGLFLQVQQQGLNHLSLVPLTLATNFRANQNLINWFNQQFGQVFPKQSDIPLGAITYTPSQALLNSATQTSVFFHEENESEQIVKILKDTWQAKPQTRVAILVRARQHLLEIIPMLQQQQIKYRAVELSFLRDHPLVQDLFALTRALSNKADRIAWLAILRAPWCGLALNELHTLVAHDHKKAVWDLLCETNILNFDDEGKKRLKFFMSVMGQALKQHEYLSLRDSIEQTWLTLRGPACLHDHRMLDIANLYFDLLNGKDCDADVSAIEKQLARLSLPPSSDPDIYLDIMTIHKAKGLEFDVVILPGLAKAVRQNPSSLFLWTERVDENGSQLIIAPIKSASEKEDDIYRYLKHQEALRSNYERTRLLYVAVTRAKNTLHLLVPSLEMKPDKQSFAVLL
jgi:ATP-dependent helicase/nuclease subunit A